MWLTTPDRAETRRWCKTTAHLSVIDGKLEDGCLAGQRRVDCGDRLQHGRRHRQRAAGSSVGTGGPAASMASTPCTLRH